MAKELIQHLPQQIIILHVCPLSEQKTIKTVEHALPFS